MDNDTLEYWGKLYGVVRRKKENNRVLEQRILDAIKTPTSISSLDDFTKVMHKYGFIGFRHRLTVVFPNEFPIVEISVYFFFLNISRWVQYYKLKRELRLRTAAIVKVIVKRTWYGRDI